VTLREQRSVLRRVVYGGESNFSKVIRDGFPPAKQRASSLFWSAKDRGVFAGGKTSANLAAICPW